MGLARRLQQRGVMRPNRNLVVMLAAGALIGVALLETAPQLAFAWQSLLAGVPDRRETHWPEHLAVVDEALAAHDVGLAVRAWHDAYGAALASGEWTAMLGVGDAFVKIGRMTGSRDGAKPNARLAYLLALVRAQRDGSVDGTLRAAVAFTTLGDREVAAECVRLAARLAEAHQDRAEIDRVRAFPATARPERS